MEWTVVVVIVALAELTGSILTPAIKLNTSVTRLSTLVDSLNNKLSTMENNNSEAHRRIWGELDEHKSTLSEAKTPEKDQTEAQRQRVRFGKERARPQRGPLAHGTGRFAGIFQVLADRPTPDIPANKDERTL